MRVRRWLYTVPLKLRSLFRRRAVERDLDEELHDHLEREAGRQRALGVDHRRAGEAARRRFGSVEAVRERCRDARGVTFVDTLRQDVLYGGRTLRRAPAFTVAATLTLALGIGASTAIVSLVDGVLVAPLPFPDPGRLVEVTGTWPRGGLAALRAQARTMSPASYADGHAFTLRGDGEAFRVRGALVSAELFTVLGAQPTRGRVLAAGEDVVGQDRVVVLSDPLWRRLGADPGIVGRAVELDGVRRTVVGVMPASFSFPSRDTELWAPFALDPADVVATWAGDFMPVVARLRPGASREQAHAEIRLLQPRVAALFPWQMPASWNRDVGVVPLKHGMVSGVRARLLVLLSAVVLVLLVACANVANLTLARAATRTHEMGVRAALGAAPSRLARQLLTESAVLATLGGMLGVAFAVAGLPLLKQLLPADTPRLDEVSINWRVLAWAGVLTLATGCLCGLAPVRLLLRRGLRSSVDAGGRGASRGVPLRLRSLLTVAEISCAVLLLIGAVLLMRGLWMLSSVDPGFRAEQVITARINPDRATCGEPERCLAFYRALESRARAIPGVVGAGLVNTLPLGGGVSKRSLELEGLPRSAGDSAPLFWLTVVTPEYLDVMRIRVASGRGFTLADNAGARVAVVTARSARRFWPGESAIGKRVRFVGEREWRTIVGVLADVRAFDLKQDVPSWMDGALYVPFGPQATLEGGGLPSEMALTLRTTVAPATVAAALRRIAAEESRGTAVSDIVEMRAIVSDAVAAPASMAVLAGAFALLALTLGSIGVYGVLSFAVSRLTKEIGVRVALGAQRRDISWLVLSEGAKLGGAGILLGAADAALSMRWLASELHGVSPFDPATYALVVCLVAIVTLAACYVPARRAMRVDPLVALRD